MVVTLVVSWHGMGENLGGQTGRFPIGAASADAYLSLNGMEKFVFFIGLVVFLGGVFTLFSYAYRKVYWIEGTGKVLSFSKSRNEESGPIADIGFEVDGVMFEVKGDSLRFLGDPVKVRYSKEDPSRAIVDEARLQFLVPIMLLGFGAMLVMAILEL